MTPTSTTATATLGELITRLFSYYLSLCGNEDDASVLTALAINELLAADEDAVEG
jgi:hypothetical protein